MLTHVKQRLHTDTSYKQQNREKAASRMKQKLGSDSKFTERNRKLARTSYQRRQQANRERVKEINRTSQRKIRQDPEKRELCKENDILRKRVTRSMNTCRICCRLKCSIRSHVASAQKPTRSGCKVKTARTAAQVYWLRRKRAIATARDQKTLTAVHKKMSEQSGATLLDVRLQFNKAKRAIQRADLYCSHLHDKLVRQATSITQCLNPNDTQLTESDINSAFSDDRSHTASAEPYFWETAYHLTTAISNDPIPVDLRGKAHIFQPTTPTCDTPSEASEVSTVTDTTLSSNKVTPIKRLWQCICDRSVFT